MGERLEVLVDGGKATAGPPLGPALGPLGVNIMAVVQAINEKTKQFAGMKVPVTLDIDPKTKTYVIEVGTPPVSALILKEIGAEKGSGDTPRTRVGNVSLRAVMKIADMKEDALLGRSRKARVLEVLGTCQSIGVTVEGKAPKEVQGDVREGRWDRLLRSS
jgi:large subunit ribosomal protein L11